MEKLDDEEQQFYDRIHLKIQLLGLKQVGCHSQAYMEFKADDLHNHIVFLITR